MILKIFCSYTRKAERFVFLDEQIKFFTPKKGYLLLYVIWTLKLELAKYYKDSEMTAFISERSRNSK